MKYDDALWHYKADFPRGFPKEYAGTHIGLFLKYCFQKGWAGETHLTNAPDDCAAVIRGSMTGTEFLFLHCDGTLSDRDLSSMGNHFAREYYADFDAYLTDYINQFGEQMFRSPEIDHDFDLYYSMLESRLIALDLSDDDSEPEVWKPEPVVAKPKKRWWQFWKW